MTNQSKPPTWRQFMEDHIKCTIAVTYIISMHLVVIYCVLKKQETNNYYRNMDTTFYLSTNAIIIYRIFELNLFTKILHALLQISCPIIMIYAKLSGIEERYYNSFKFEIYLLIVLHILQIILALIFVCIDKSVQMHAKLYSIHIMFGSLIYITHTWNFLVQAILWDELMGTVAEFYILLILFLFLTPVFQSDFRPGSEKRKSTLGTKKSEKKLTRSSSEKNTKKNEKDGNKSKDSKDPQSSKDSKRSEDPKYSKDPSKPKENTREQPKNPQYSIPEGRRRSVRL